MNIFSQLPLHRGHWKTSKGEYRNPTLVHYLILLTKSSSAQSVGIQLCSHVPKNVGERPSLRTPLASTSSAPQSVRYPKASFPGLQSMALAHSCIRPYRVASALSAAPNSTPKSLTKPSAISGPLRSNEVNTNPGSYDSRDTFNASNTLTELLISLASCVITGGSAGCQCRLLTIDGRKSCFHLCNAVEPFVLPLFLMATTTSPYYQMRQIPTHSKDPGSSSYVNQQRSSIILQLVSKCVKIS